MFNVHAHFQLAITCWQFVNNYRGVNPALACFLIYKITVDIVSKACINILAHESLTLFTITAQLTLTLSQGNQSS